MTITRRRSSQSLQQSIQTEMLGWLGAGKYAAGEYLPSTRELAKSFGTSITPVNLALNALAKEGYVSKIHGSGVRVEARDRSEVATLAKPLVDLLLWNYQSAGGDAQPPQRSHILPALSDWLLWRLARQSNLRVSVGYTSPEARDDFLERIRDARFLKPAVFVFAHAEALDKELTARLAELAASGTHVIYRASIVDLPFADRVYSDFEQGQASLTRHFLERGHRRMLRLSTGPGKLYEKQKSAGYRRAALDAGLAEKAWGELVVPQRTEALPPSERVARLTELLREPMKRIRPTVVFAINDPEVPAVRLALRALGVSDVEVAGYDADWSEMHAALVADYGADVVAGAAPVTVDVNLPKVAEAMAEMTLARAFGRLDGKPQGRTVSQTLVAG